MVQNELKHLDSLLSADVAILRDKIEAASIDYLRAQWVVSLLEHLINVFILDKLLEAFIYSIFSLWLLDCWLQKKNLKYF